MELIVLNGYKPPNPSTYDVEYSDVNGEESPVEDGTKFIERVRSDVPTIKLAWTNLKHEDMKRIISELSNDIILVHYWFGEYKPEEMTVSARSLKLKFIDDSGNMYWDLSATLDC